MTKKTDRASAPVRSRADIIDKVEVRVWRDEDARAGKSAHSFATMLTRAQWDELTTELDKLEKRLDLEARRRKLDAIYALERKWLAEDEAALAAMWA
ncbi:hypothetical protein EN858_21760 [Mesorhizobium sp. M4B.F.Ca.ET.215.01.1.1]|uniref:hypothetical protein n=1 Tax=unclassified Mesorhizobium TaxID=325217 RepID=UPI000FCC0409|nr:MULTISPECIES: hypothetical protein [unclassified Mesorhizobium]RVD40395.1 hypothetical protein EN741_16820 [Mesorhizobium sp. M4B.F.Ca.ET.019.03.1.1]TGQ08363.1 hypothetical protein EN858_21760 [Mesorhizobium sp. M4B.F.Ca.ET.215.01.1.1]TGQ41060.1 hypothetical protein EN863_021845 [Mesorhizobium sp. M00.F.Ca.ET.220.01.1.1]TGR01920.1 hypothetical protein EN846_18620 [Mesorhizobium sp. M4B.F.Ca.ET.203.01.1.1]TGT45395.1 hypothetical protein EN812_09660 [Mesorhizobium sp. M4B.F.Ca.ET.169.01.1.1]